MIGRAKRCSFETFMDVLLALMFDDKGITRIMYASNTSYVAARKAIAWVIGRGFVVARREDEQTVYALTERGMDVLVKYMAFKRALLSTGSV